MPPVDGTPVEYYLQYESAENEGVVGLAGVPYNIQNDATAQAAVVEIVGRNTDITVIDYRRTWQAPRDPLADELGNRVEMLPDPFNV